MQRTASRRDDFAPPPAPVKRWTVDEYHKLLDCGFFAENEAFELIDGWIIPKCKRSPWHCAVQNYLLDQFVDCLPDGYVEYMGCSITMSASEPEADLAIVRGPMRYDRHSFPEEVLVAIEVCEQNTVARDYDLKMNLYAREGIREYWIVDHASQEVKIFTRPVRVGDTAAKYESCEVFPKGKTVPLVLDGKHIIDLSIGNARRKS
jgi:Uma2 family endonuclease